VRLVLLRHGQSEWNAAGIFAGWENAHLTAHGEAEATRAGSMLRSYDVAPPPLTAEAWQLQLDDPATPCFHRRRSRVAGPCATSPRLLPYFYDATCTRTRWAASTSIRTPQSPGQVD